MRLLKYLLLLLPLFGLGSCDWNPYSGEVGHSYTPWIATMNLDGSNVQYIHQGYGNSFFCHDPLYNRERILTVNADSLYIMDVDGGNLEVLETYPTSDLTSTFTRFNYKTGRLVLQIDGDIFLYSLANREQTRITDSYALEIMPAISSDGKYIAYVSTNRSDSLECIAFKKVEDLNSESIISSNLANMGSFWTPAFSSNNELFFWRSLSTEHPIGVYNATVGIMGDHLSIEGNANLRLDACANRACAIVNHKIVLFDSGSFRFMNTTDSYGTQDCPTLSEDGIYIMLGSLVYNIQSDVPHYIKKDFVPYTYSCMNIADSQIVANIYSIN